MSCWTDGKLYKLVQLYSELSNLWDRKHHCYDNLRARYTSYSKIVTSLSMPTCVSVSDVICKLKELRNIYVSELKKIEMASRSGCIYRPNYTWFGIMNEFLYDHLDADEKLAELSSSEDGTESSEEIFNVRFAKDCCSDLNFASESDSKDSLDSGCKNSARKFQKPAKKSQAYFLRSPTILRSTKMNTTYEYPRKKRASSMPVKSFTTRNLIKLNEEMQQCTQLDVKLTSSDVSVKYLRTERVNGDEKCYKKNFKGPRCSTDKPKCFKNIQMTISKSGYTASGLENTSNQGEDEDAELWEMMSMLDLGVPCPLTKVETTHFPNACCTSVTSINPVRKSDETCCVRDKNRVENIVESADAATTRKSRGSNDREAGRQSCCSKGKAFEECEEMKREEDTPLESCTKKIKVMCLGDGTLFDDNLLELLQDLSIKICPVDGQCASGNCAAEQPGHAVLENLLPCATCSSATRLVKEYETDEDDETGSGNAYATPRGEESADYQDGVESATKPERDFDVDIERDETDAGPLNTEVRKEAGSSVSPARKNHDVEVLLGSADGRSSSEREAVLHEAKKELREAGKLYNGGKYIVENVVGPGPKREALASEFDHFGAQVASTLNTMGKQRAMKLKKMIAETLKGDKINKFL